MTASAAARWLVRRADSYGRDAWLLRSNGHLDEALIFEAIRDELRSCAALLAAGGKLPPHTIDSQHSAE